VSLLLVEHIIMDTRALPDTYTLAHGITITYVTGPAITGHVGTTHHLIGHFSVMELHNTAH